MTRKHFIKVAAGIRTTQLSWDERLYLIDVLGDIFKSINPKYDHLRFKAACLPVKS